MRAMVACLVLLSGEVTPLPVEPMGPMTSKNVNGFQWRESNYLSIVYCAIVQLKAVEQGSQTRGPGAN